MTDFKAAAERYFNERGWTCIPLINDAEGRPKRPFQPQWQRTPHDWGAIAKLPWEHALGIGIVLGPVSDNLAVIDIDDDALATELLRILTESKARFYYVRTGRNRCHIYFREETPSNPSTFRNQQWRDRSFTVELKARGQQVAAPPTPGYTYLGTRDDPTPVPNIAGAWGAISGTMHIGAPGAHGTSGYPAPWRPEVPDGERNNTLFVEACRLAEAGMPVESAIDTMVARVRLVYAGTVDERELQRTVRSAYRTQRRNNRNSRLLPPPPLDNDSGAPPADDELPLTNLPLTDMGNAELFARLHGASVRFDWSRERWLSYNEHRWHADYTDEVMRLAKHTARRRLVIAADVEQKPQREAIVKWARASEARARLDAMVALARAELPISDRSGGWDETPWLLGVANGVVDLRSGTHRRGEPADRVTLSTGIGFDPAARCPRWLHFVEEVFEDDQELIGYVQRLVGYALTGDVSEQVFAMLHGTGANGKSVFLTVIGWLAGEYALNLPFATFELHDRSNLSPDLAMLPNRRLITASETQENSRLNEARLKSLTGGDMITANPKYRNPFQFRPMAHIFLAVNHRPVVHDDSVGFWRRVHLVPFTRTFRGAAVDPILERRLLEELPGIMNWAIQGATEWYKNRLRPPAVVLRQAARWRAESDPFGDFLTEQVVADELAALKASDFYAAYTAWADANHLPPRERLSANGFGRKVGDRYHRIHQKTGWYYTGIRCDGFPFTHSITSQETGIRHHNGQEDGGVAGDGFQPVTDSSNLGDGFRGRSVKPPYVFSRDRRLIENPSLPSPDSSPLGDGSPDDPSLPSPDPDDPF